MYNRSIVGRNTKGDVSLLGMEVQGLSSRYECIVYLNNAIIELCLYVQSYGMPYKMYEML